MSSPYDPSDPTQEVPLWRPPGQANRFPEPPPSPPVFPPDGPEKLTKQQRAWQFGGIGFILLLVIGLSGAALFASMDNGSDKSDKRPVSVKATPPPTASPTPGSPPPILLGEGVVANVVSGDTLDVTLSGQNREVHVLGITAPQADKQQCWGTESQQFASQTLQNVSVRLYLAPGAQPPAQNETINADVMLPDGRNYAALAVTAGAAKTDTQAGLSNAASALTADQTQASDSHQGVWGTPCHGSFAPPAAPAPAVRENPPPTGIPHPTKPSKPTRPTRPTKPTPTKTRPTTRPTKPTHTPPPPPPTKPTHTPPPPPPTKPTPTDTPSDTPSSAPPSSPPPSSPPPNHRPPHHRPPHEEHGDTTPSAGGPATGTPSSSGSPGR